MFLVSVLLLTLRIGTGKIVHHHVDHVDREEEEEARYRIIGHQEEHEHADKDAVVVSVGVGGSTNLAITTTRYILFLHI